MLGFGSVWVRINQTFDYFCKCANIRKFTTHRRNEGRGRGLGPLILAKIRPNVPDLSAGPTILAGFWPEWGDLFRCARN